MGRATLPAGGSRRVGQDVGPHPIGTHRWAAKGGPVHVKTHLSGPLGKDVGQSPRTALQAQQVKTPSQTGQPEGRAGTNCPRPPTELANQKGGLEPTERVSIINPDNPGSCLRLVASLAGPETPAKSTSRTVNQSQGRPRRVR